MKFTNLLALAAIVYAQEEEQVEEEVVEEEVVEEEENLDEPPADEPVVTPAEEAAVATPEAGAEPVTEDADAPGDATSTGEEV